MNADRFDKLEQDVEREVEWLRELPQIELPAHVLPKARAAVQAEAARFAAPASRPRRTAPWWLHRAAGIAAAVGLGLLLLPIGRPGVRPLAANLADDLALDAWAAALRESTAQLALQMDGYDASLFGDDTDDWLSLDDLAGDSGA
jgi:hypothetical protein